jgi:CheY-like chemotaxis protein
MKKIIIAEPIIRDIERNNTVFGRGSISVISARSSEEILKLHGSHQADLIITDFDLPLMGAAQLCSLIRNDDSLKHVSIIIVCNASDVSLADCRKSGANAIVPKPASPDALFAKMSELLIVPQRKDIRVLQRISVKSTEGDTTFFAQSLNISISGMLIETDRVLKKGDRLTCSFNIAHSEVVVDCTVMRIEKNSSGRIRYGIKFMNFNTKSLVIIDHFVKSQLKH